MLISKCLKFLGASGEKVGSCVEVPKPTLGRLHGIRCIEPFVVHFQLQWRGFFWNQGISHAHLSQNNASFMMFFSSMSFFEDNNKSLQQISTFFESSQEVKPLGALGLRCGFASKELKRFHWVPPKGLGTRKNVKKWNHWWCDWSYQIDSNYSHLWMILNDATRMGRTCEKARHLCWNLRYLLYLMIFPAFPPRPLMNIMQLNYCTFEEKCSALQIRRYQMEDPYEHSVK